MPELSALLFPSASSMCIPESSASPSPFAFDVRVSGLSIQSASNVPVPRSFIPPSLSGHLLVPDVSAPSSLSTSGVCMLGLSAPPTFGTPMSGSSASPSSSDYLPLPRSSVSSLSRCLLVPRSSAPSLFGVHVPELCPP